MIESQQNTLLSEKQVSDSSEIYSEIKIQPKNIQESQLFQKYLSFFPHEESQTKNNTFETLPTSKNNFIYFNQEEYQNKLVINILEHSSNYEAIKCQIKIGHFTLQLSILNINGNSCCHLTNKIESTFASIYFTESQYGKIAIKCFQIKIEQYSKTLMNVINEYCLLKIASAVTAGPRHITPFGFDLVIYDNCIEFAMEYCQHQTSLSQNQQNILKQKLKQLHLRHIVHLDIKPQNIGFSPFYKNPVFIDFGLSKSIKQKIGEKTSTLFAGSPDYCSHEMIKLISCYKPAFVDLYYNDIYALTETFSAMKKVNQDNIFTPQFLKNKKGELQMMKTVINTFVKMEIKYKLFVCQLQELKQIQLIKFILANRQILQFIQKLPYSSFNEEIQRKIANFFSIQNNEIKIGLNFQQKKHNELFIIPYLNKYNNSSNKKQNNLIKMQLFEAYNEDFQKRVHCLLYQKGKDIEECDIKQFKIKKLRSIFLNRQNIPKLQKIYYCEAFIHFINFTTNNSLLIDKFNAAKIMNQYFKLPFSKSEQNNQQIVWQSEFKCLIECIKFAKQLLLTNILNNPQQTIPILFTHLILFQILQESQLLDDLQKIIQLNAIPLQHAAILFRCYIGSKLIKYRTASKYNEILLGPKIHKAINHKIIKIKNQNPQNYIYYNTMLQLINVDEITRNPNKISLQVINFLKRGQSSKQQQYLFKQLHYYWTLITLQYIKGIQKVQQLPSLLELCNKQQKYFQKQGLLTFKYYEFKIVQGLFVLNSQAPQQQLYNRFILCYQHPFLIQSFQIYYRCERKLYIDNKKARYYYDIMQSMDQNQLLKSTEMIQFVLTIVTSGQIDQPDSKDIKAKIYQFCSQAFSLKKLKSFQKQQRQCQNTHMKKYYKNWSLIFKIVLKVNSKNNYKILQFQELFHDIQKSWQQESCLKCKEWAQCSMLRIKCDILEIFNKTELKLKAYIQFLFEHQKLKKVNSIKTVVLQTLQLCLTHPQLPKHYNSSSILFSIIHNNSMYSQLLNSGRIFYGINYICFVFDWVLNTLGNVQQYFKLHLLFCNIIREFPSKTYISRYSNQTGKFIYQSCHSSFKQFLSVNLQNYKNQTSYIVLFYALLLQKKRVVTILSIKLIKYICDKVKHIVSYARRCALLSVYAFGIKLLLNTNIIIDSQLGNCIFYNKILKFLQCSDGVDQKKRKERMIFYRKRTLYKYGNEFRIKRQSCQTFLKMVKNKKYSFLKQTNIHRILIEKLSVMQTHMTLQASNKNKKQK